MASSIRCPGSRRGQGLKILEGQGYWESQGMTKGHDLFRKLAKKGKKSLCLELLESR